MHVARSSGSFFDPAVRRSRPLPEEAQAGKGRLGGHLAALVGAVTARAYALLHVVDALAVSGALLANFVMLRLHVPPTGLEAMGPAGTCSGSPKCAVLIRGGYGPGGSRNRRCQQDCGPEPLCSGSQLLLMAERPPRVPTGVMWQY